MGTDEVAGWTIGELGARLRRRELSPVEATSALLARIERLDPRLHAYARVAPESALAQARQAERELAQGLDRGPLHGIPLAVKDLCDWAGLPTGAGTRVLADRVAESDACLVERLRAAGAVLLGKLALAEGAYCAHHPSIPAPVNPWDAARWPGISSSGSGVATAAGLCLASLGTDTGGSIRFPSAANGVVGLKPTWGRVPRHGVFPLAPSLDHVGPMARRVADAAAVLAAIAGSDARDPTSLRAPVPDLAAAAAARDLTGLRVGLDRAYACEGMDAEVVEAVLAAAQGLAAAGALLREVRVPPWLEVVRGWAPLAAAEAAVAHAELFPARRAEYGPALAAFLDLGRAATGCEVARVLDARLAFAGRLAGLFVEVDLLVCPSLGLRVPPADVDLAAGTDAAWLERLTRFTVPFDFSGSPTLSLPCGFASDGLPISLQLVARPLEEALLVRAGAVYERATAWHEHHPPVRAG